VRPAHYIKVGGYVEGLCAPFYADEGLPGLPLGHSFRLLLIRYFRGVGRGARNSVAGGGFVCANFRYSFIALCLVSFSIITVAFADTLAAGGNLARALCAFFALFWMLRLIAGTFVFDMRPYLTSSYHRLGYHAINVVFAYLPVVYALAASRPHWLR